MQWRRALSGGLVGLIWACGMGCGEPTDRARTVRAAPGAPPVVQVRPPSDQVPGPTDQVRPPSDQVPAPTDQAPLPSPTPVDQPVPRSTPSEPPPADSRDMALEVLVGGPSLEIGWTGEPVEPIAAWPPPPGPAVLPELVAAARGFTERELAAADQRPGQTFDRLARLLVEDGVAMTGEQFSRLLRSLQEAGYVDIAVQVGAEPLELRVPLPPRPPEVAPGVASGLGYARLRWATSPAGTWVDGDAVYSEPHRGDDAAPGLRPDLAVGLRSAWSCALVEPEPTFVDAVRRTTSALETFRLPADTTIYVELTEDAPFAEGWRLARELRAAGHDRVGFLRGVGGKAVAQSCPADARNAATLAARAQQFEGQIRGEDVERGHGLDHFGLRAVQAVPGGASSP
mgnify:CR=1 FL=1